MISKEWFLNSITVTKFNTMGVIILYNYLAKLYFINGGHNYIHY